MKRTYAILFSLLGLSGISQQKMTLKDCEDALRQNNLQLLAAQFDIAAANAAIIQARIWEQPVVSGQVNAYNPDDRQVFDAGKRGQKAVGIDQLIYLGGKKRNEVKLAKANSRLAELEFESLLNNLRFELRKSFYTVYFDQKKIEAIDSQLSRIESLQQAYEAQAAKGNVALRDVVRLQSLLLGFRNERVEILKSNYQERQNLSLLTGLSEPVEPVVDETASIARYLDAALHKETLFVEATEKNPDYRLAKSIVEAREMNLKWQKSLAIPDVTLGAGYDQMSGAFNNETNLNISIPLPLWNKNKGNIEMAKAGISQAKAESSLREAELRASIESAYAIWAVQRQQVADLKASVAENLESVNHGIFENFQKRNVSLFEFTDFMESYNSSVLQINELHKQLVLSAEALNRLTNSDNF